MVCIVFDLQMDHLDICEEASQVFENKIKKSNNSDPNPFKILYFIALLFKQSKWNWVY